VAQDVIASAGIYLALIGPFDDGAPFEQLLASA
jgi:hypothetical protein